MKKLDDICFIVQARLNSQRVPQKMIKPFAGSNLFELIIDKLILTSGIANIYMLLDEQLIHYYLTLFNKNNLISCSKFSSGIKNSSDNLLIKLLRLLFWINFSI